MAERRAPIRKSPDEILTDLVDGHREALIGGADRGRKYLLTFSERNHSIPNAVKFFLYDLLADAAHRADDPDGCRAAIAKAAEHLPAAQDELPQRFRAYVPSIRFFEVGITLAIDEGEFENALALCKRAIALGLGPVYDAKRASIERML